MFGRKPRPKDVVRVVHKLNAVSKDVSVDDVWLKINSLLWLKPCYIEKKRSKYARIRVLWIDFIEDEPLKFIQEILVANDLQGCLSNHRTRKPVQCMEEIGNTSYLGKINIPKIWNNPHKSILYIIKRPESAHECNRCQSIEHLGLWVWVLIVEHNARLD